MAGDLLDAAFDEEDSLHDRKSSFRALVSFENEDARGSFRRPARQYEELIGAGSYDDHDRSVVAAMKLRSLEGETGTHLRRSASACTRKSSFKRPDTQSWISADGASRRASAIVDGRLISIAWPES